MMARLVQLSGHRLARAARLSRLEKLRRQFDYAKDAYTSGDVDAETFLRIITAFESARQDYEAKTA
jgi:hypothetical protein